MGGEKGEKKAAERKGLRNEERKENIERRCLEYWNES